MHLSRKLLLIGGLVLALSVGGVGVALATRGDDGDTEATGPGVDRARAAALQVTGGGEVASVERESEGDEAWEVEVRKADGTTVDVSLNGSYERLAVEREDDDRGEGKDDRDERGDD